MKKIISIIAALSVITGALTPFKTQLCAQEESAEAEEEEEDQPRVPRHARRRAAIACWIPTTLVIVGAVTLAIISVNDHSSNGH